MKSLFANAQWQNQPKTYEINDSSVKITTETNTDYWQRSYYGFRNDNAPTLLMTGNDNFSFTTKVSFK
jgi:regulation of enolase protein 1 (concanavalin A-like superfamily)